MLCGLRVTIISLLVVALSVTITGCGGNETEPSGTAPPTAEIPTSAPDPGGSAAYQVIEVVNPGTLAVTVLYTGADVPEPAEVAVNINEDFCGHKVFTENLLVDKATRGLQNVVVRLENVRAGKPVPESVLVTNKNCAFSPHVSVAVRKAKIDLRNADPVLHTTHPYLNDRHFFNIALHPGTDPPTPRPIPRSGLMVLTCDVHKWMRGYVWVHDNPYLAVTDQQGKLVIEDVPPGSYSYVAWHEELGRRKGEVAVTADQTTTLQIEFEP